MITIFVLICGLHVPVSNNNLDCKIEKKEVQIKPTSTKIYKKVPTPWIKIAKNSN